MQIILTSSLRPLLLCRNVSSRLECLAPLLMSLSPCLSVFAVVSYTTTSSLPLWPVALPCFEVSAAPSGRWTRNDAPALSRTRHPPGNKNHRHGTVKDYKSLAVFEYCATSDLGNAMPRLHRNIIKMHQCVTQSYPGMATIIFHDAT